MKKLFIAALIVATFITSAFAKGPAGVNFLAQRTFNTEFSDASNVSWTSTPNYIKATFVYEDQRMEAFYNMEGEKIGTARGVALDGLPVKAKRAFAKSFDGYEVKESILFEGTEESAYFLSAENEKESLIVKVYNNGETYIYKKTKK